MPLSVRTRYKELLKIRLDVPFELSTVLGSRTPVTGLAHRILSTQIGTCRL